MAQFPLPRHMPTEWVHTLLKPWNFFDETPTLGALKKDN